MFNMSSCFFFTLEVHQYFGALALLHRLSINSKPLSFSFPYRNKEILVSLGIFLNSSQTNYFSDFLQVLHICM
uniref:Putative secreted protein n=1 Tax=Anopheles marajoara TaxID=58244 RepID=A0A2M4CEU0_9DIPT